MSDRVFFAGFGACRKKRPMSAPVTPQRKLEAARRDRNSCKWTRQPLCQTAARILLHHQSLPSVGLFGAQRYYFQFAGPDSKRHRRGSLGQTPGRQALRWLMRALIKIHDANLRVSAQQREQKFKCSLRTKVKARHTNDHNCFTAGRSP